MTTSLTLTQGRSTPVRTVRGRTLAAAAAVAAAVAVPQLFHLLGAFSGAGASFAQADFLPHWPPAAFHLKSAQTPQPDVLWLRYTRP